MTVLLAAAGAAPQGPENAGVGLCKPSPVPRSFPGAVNISLQGPGSPHGLVEQPGSGRARAAPSPAVRRGMLPLFALAPGGVCRAVQVTLAAVRSYRTVSPLPREPEGPVAVSSLWHCPAARADWSLTSTLPCGARTFLPSPRPAATGVHPGLVVAVLFPFRDDVTRATPAHPAYRAGHPGATRAVATATSPRRWPGCSSRRPRGSLPGGCAGASPGGSP